MDRELLKSLAEDLESALLDTLDDEKFSIVFRSLKPIIEAAKRKEITEPRELGIANFFYGNFNIMFDTVEQKRVDDAFGRFYGRLSLTDEQYEKEQLRRKQEKAKKKPGFI
ncbi:hypothetical protein [Marinomonas mediterranea]|uniref:hypothetical protein n=1 Tax=Marinomonas mediterranea TaxID=119864 RepID=UPI00234B8A96|nr:hypothetical protein [Marinomonas mediterranea]WCN07792.1 hypothetical protein GV055_02055 [Marinomonas mediterranea]